MDDEANDWTLTDAGNHAGGRAARSRLASAIVPGVGIVTPFSGNQIMAGSPMRVAVERGEDG
jgi:hypothetical protein